MTHEILQSDVDLARRLLKAKCPDQEVVSALSRRGIEAPAAEQLVQDLHQGNPVNVRVELGGFRQSSDAETNPLYEERYSRSSSPAASRRRSWPWFIIGVLALGCGMAAGVTQYEKWYHRQTVFLLDSFEKVVRELEQPKPDVHLSATARAMALDSRPLEQFRRLKSQIEQRRMDEAEQARLLKLSREGAEVIVPSTTPLRPKPLVELGPAGLNIEGRQLVPAEALAILLKTLGPASRTNWVESGATVHYIFDRHGILLCAPRDAQPDCLLLDFDGEGGEYGTQSPFSGVLRIGTQQIPAKTSVWALSGNPQLSLTNTSDGRILTGRCNGFGTVCSFLKSPDRLSSIEIHLRN